MNEPEIASKVKFWEEQQRINSLLIPRVADLVDSSKKTGATLEELRRAATTAEQRLLRRASQIEAELRSSMKEVQRVVGASADRDRRVLEMEATMAKFGESFVRWESSIGALTQEARSSLDDTERRHRLLAAAADAAHHEARLAKWIGAGAALLGIIGLFT